LAQRLRRLARGFLRGHPFWIFLEKSRMDAPLKPLTCPSCEAAKGRNKNP